MRDNLPVKIDTQPGPQTKAAESDADIVVYGGAAGGGKSWLAIYDLGKYSHVPGYGGILFRRTSPELVGSDSVWSLAGKLYPLLGGEGKKSPVLQYDFPSGGLVEFRHLQHETDVSAHQSKAYARAVFDEATHFTGDQFWFIFSRLRTTSGVPLRFLLTCNPDPDSFILTELIGWWIGADGYPIPERDGVKRWFVRDTAGAMVWADTREELAHMVEDLHDVISVTFIASKVTDNKILLESDKKYIGKLRNLTPVLRARMLGGNWRIREGAGDMFQRGWFPVVPNTPLGRVAAGYPLRLDFVRKVRWWDRASTPFFNQLVPGIQRPADFRARREGNPDWSRGLLAGLTRPFDAEDRGRIVLMDMVSYRDTGGAIEQAIIRQALIDGPMVLVGVWVDPAQAGSDQALRMKRLLNKRGIGVVLGPQVKNKREYATLPSQLAYNGGIWVMDDGSDGMSWLPFWNEIEAFPPALGTPESKKPKDDQVDVLSGVVGDLDRHRKDPWPVDPDVERNPSRDHSFFTPDEDDDLEDARDVHTRTI